MSEYRNHKGPMSLGEYYIKHIQAITSEDLHSKSDTACEFAYRDKLIAELEKELADMTERFETLNAQQEEYKLNED